MTQLHLYQTVHVAGGYPRSTEAHAALLTEAARIVFGTEYAPDIPLLEKRIMAVARAENYPQEVSGFVRIELTAEGEERLRPAGVSLYDGYALRGVTPDACTVCYELPFAGMPTSAHEAAARLADRQARQKGAALAVHCTREGVCLSADCAPLFAVRDKEVLVSPLPGVERELAVQAIRALGLRLSDEPILRDSLARYDELFYVDRRGITALAHCDGVPYMSLAAERIAAEMEMPF